MLLARLEDEAGRRGFSEIRAMTVPPEKKPAYAGTVSFYLKNGFLITNRYPDLWESGAILLEKKPALRANLSIC
jgi:hypothetical protein